MTSPHWRNYASFIFTNSLNLCIFSFVVRGNNVTLLQSLSQGFIAQLLFGSLHSFIPHSRTSIPFIRWTSKDVEMGILLENLGKTRLKNSLNDWPNSSAFSLCLNILRVPVLPSFFVKSWYLYGHLWGCPHPEQITQERKQFHPFWRVRCVHSRCIHFLLTISYDRATT